MWEEWLGAGVLVSHAAVGSGGLGTPVGLTHIWDEAPGRTQRERRERQRRGRLRL